MKKLIVLTILAMVTGCVLSGSSDLPVVAAVHSTSPGLPDSQASRPTANLADNGRSPVGAPGPSCAHPTSDEAHRCVELEQGILASTVRIEWNLWVEDGEGHGYCRVDRIAHGTVKQGRYLVTHNHSQVLQSDVKNKGFNRVSVFRADGTLIWPKGPLNTITIAAKNDETVVLDFGDYSGQGLFTILGIPSAEFRDWETLPLRPGMEVAQVVWDGSGAYVDWVTIEDVITTRAPPRLELDALVTSGASGGGVFWNGYHVANTWCNGTVYHAKDGGVSRQFSVAALNSSQVAAPLH